MKKTNKEQIELTLKLFAETLSRQFAISDDDEPAISIEYMRECSGVFEALSIERRIRNLIRINPSLLWDINLVAHELAHWVQNSLVGDTQCEASFGRSANRDAALIKQHTILTSQIEALLITSGHANFIKRLWHESYA